MVGPAWVYDWAIRPPTSDGTDHLDASPTPGDHLDFSRGLNHCSDHRGPPMTEPWRRIGNAWIFVTLCADGNVKRASDSIGLTSDGGLLGH